MPSGCSVIWRWRFSWGVGDMSENDEYLPMVVSRVLVGELLGELIYVLDDHAQGFTCHEAEAVAKLYRIAGMGEQAEEFLTAHAVGDGEPDDGHAVGTATCWGCGEPIGFDHSAGAWVHDHDGDPQCSGRRMTYAQPIRATWSHLAD